MVASVLPADSVYGLPGSHAVMKKVAVLERSTWQRTKGGLWPVVSLDLRPSVQWPLKT